MSYDPKQFRTFVERTLAEISLPASAPGAVELLMMTGAHETHLGRWMWQANLDPSKGGACGVFQMEPRTHDDVQKRLIVGKGIYQWLPIADAKMMIWNLKYAIHMARIYFTQFPEPIPMAREVLELAKYYKKYWNTESGSAEVPSVIENYYTFAHGEMA